MLSTNRLFFAFPLVFVILLVAARPIEAQGINAGTPEFFENKIRPILANNCFGCHTNSQLGGLRLDSLEAMKKGGKRGASIVPGDPENSLLIKAVRQTDPALKMPYGGKLKATEIAELEAWVKAGAAWPASTASAATSAKDGKYVISAERHNFWSFLPLKTPAEPAVKDTKWPKTDIDRFVLARLEQEGIKPAAPASKHDLLRRAYLDLTGLPPKPEDEEAFEKDKSTDAFAKVVDRLLASPHYGERWGRIWLDVARYGEDDYRSLNPFPRGFRPYPNAWAYRDWVVRAFNDDLPYDQFVKAQLAGDLMDPKVRYKTLPATGFLGLGPWYYDNGSNEVTRADERHDRVDAVTRGFLGLTVQCARCHDHKYDPIPQSDYYALAGVFFNTIYEEYPQAPSKVVAQFKKTEDEIDEKEKVFQELRQTLTGELARSLSLQTSNYIMGTWEVTGKEKKDIAMVVNEHRLDYELLDRWIKYLAKPTVKYHNKDEWQALMKKGGGSRQDAKKLADKFQQEIIDVTVAKDAMDEENRVITDKDVDGSKPKKQTDKPSNFVSNKDFNPGALLRLKSLPDEQTNLWTEIFVRELKDTEDANDMVEMDPRKMSPGVLMFRGWGLESRLGPESQARLKSLQDDLEALKKTIDPYYPFIHGVKDSGKPVNIQLALRGNPETLGSEVPRHFLSIFSQSDPTPLDQGSGRMQLAELIVKQPIAMRVIANRIWKADFGTGIVDTPSNFGFGGERPTNPDLLEYLANEFVKNGMSIKKLQRQIMLSSVYQLSTTDDKLASEKDSGNRLYWRASRKRMDAEQVRDSILQVAGELDDSIGGPPKELTPDYHRRTVYGHVSRYKLDAYLQLFDFPPPNISAEKRFTTTVPLQRLFLMNSDFVQLESEALYKRVAAEADNRARIRKLYNLVYNRDPKEAEVQIGLEYLKTEPIREYEERKAKEQEKEKEKEKKPVQAEQKTPSEGAMPTTADAKPAMPKANVADQEPSADAAMPDESAEATPPADPNAGMGMGMMAGVPGKGGPAKPAEIKYEPTIWGRYTKLLLSSTEFIFIN
jgi:mono/diheme cytochrome c family protein